MIKDTIVQYVCFVTNLGLEEFMPEWQRYAKRMKAENFEVTLYEQSPGSKNRFHYFSRHEWANGNANLNFFENRKSEHLPEHVVKVVQAGGYLRLLPVQRKEKAKGDIFLVAFVGHNDTDIEFYQHLTQYTRLTIHQAYFESCAYGYILEFIVPARESNDLISLLKLRPSVETYMYSECQVPAVKV